MGSQMNSHFSAAAAGVSGYGGSIVKESMDKYKKEQEEKMKKSREQGQQKKDGKK